MIKTFNSLNIKKMYLFDKKKKNKLSFHIHVFFFYFEKKKYIYIYIYHKHYFLNKNLSDKKTRRGPDRPRRTHML